jgi:hypothetical protein
MLWKACLPKHILAKLQIYAPPPYTMSKASKLVKVNTQIVNSSVKTVWGNDIERCQRA